VIVVAFDGYGEALPELLPRAERARRGQAKDGLQLAQVVLNGRAGENPFRG
jgi:hypothetical protein